MRTLPAQRLSDTIQLPPGSGDRPPHRTRRAGLAIAVAALLVGAGACSSESGQTATTLPSTTATTTPLPSTAAPDTEVPTTTAAATTTLPTSAPPSSDATTTTTAAVPLALPRDVVVRSMSWPVAGDGWVLGSDSSDSPTLLHTSDNGATWTAVATANVVGASNIAFADADNGWIVSESGLHSTHDGGVTWSVVSLPTGADTVAAVAATHDRVFVSFADNDGVGIAESPVASDDFVAADYHLPFGAGPALGVDLSVGGSYGALVYTDRTFTGAAEIRDGEWSKWDLSCPFANPSASAGLSPSGNALTIACGPSGWGDNEPIVAADLSAGELRWVTIEPVADGPSQIEFTAATDAKVRVVIYLKVDGSHEIVSSTDAGATWNARTSVPAESGPTAIAPLPGGGLLVALATGGGLVSSDAVSWSSVPAV